MLSSLILCSNNKQFLNWIVTCDGKWIVYDNRLSGWAEKLQSSSQSQICTKKGHGHCLVVCYQSDPLQLSESWWNHSIWKVRSADRWDTAKTAMPAACISQQKGPNSSPRQRPTTHRTTNASKAEWIGLPSFATSTIFTWPLANPLLLFQAAWQLFARKMFPQPAGCRKCFPRVRWIPKHGFLCYRNNQTFLIGKHVLIIMAPIFD